MPEADPAMKFFSELKVALLKNRALAALKLNSWQEAGGLGPGGCPGRSWEGNDALLRLMAQR